MIQIDCSLLLVNLSQEYRFNWAQVKLIVSYCIKLDEMYRKLLHLKRNLHFNKTVRIHDHEDFENLLNEVKGLTHYDFLRMVGENHQNQSCFDASDFRPLIPLTCAFYVSKFQ